MARIQASEGSPLDDTDEFEDGFLSGSLRQFIFEPMDEQLRLMILKKLKDDGYAVLDVRFDGPKIELDLLDIYDKPFTVKMGNLREIR